VTLDVTNTGTRAGEDVVQLYARFPRSKVERPQKQLRAFQRVAIPPGETRTVRLDVPARDLAYWDVKRKGWTVEPGPVELLVGRSSRDADLTLRATVDVLR
jgi:beta-glucosidase